MRRLMTLGVLAVLAGTSVTAAQAEPGGCLKYGAVGAVGGHVAHHGVLGAVGGCLTGMYRRHVYRKEAKQKADLYDQEHPGAKGSYAEKATAYDVEHSTQPGKMTPDAAAPQGGAQAPAAQPQQPAPQADTHI
ncbi:hypothetical protein OQ252_12000 [Acetobacter farinalis]|uniref:Uncharacterized protein n=1 Tax=Acetobacter farinalis TaxID=1260984 RepID=A0ABT3QA15_9PROT|nr:hypothetical protein [Acetobacter farinalis]MCX2562112.1 hypothetical protein [Acetobacter farinalis]NHO30716.1 hypothetical protein [Acetobacter farinalis]